MRGINHVEDWGWSNTPRIPASAAIIGAGSLLGAGSSLLGSGKASSAAKDAAGKSVQQYYQTRADLQPFQDIGKTAAGNALDLSLLGPTGGGPDYVGMAGGMLPGGPMTQANLAATPGYQFTLDQGLKATQSAAAARGLGMSGASMKGAATYATGLADQTYQKQFQNLLALNTGQQGNLTNQFNRFNSLATLGENAGAQTGTIGAGLTNTAANATIQSGLDQAAGTTGVSNALTGGVNNYLGYQAFQNALNPQTGTSGYGTAAAGTPGISASGNPVMTGFAAPIVPGQVLPGGYTG